LRVMVASGGRLLRGESMCSFVSAVLSKLRFGGYLEG
jgi:hypothetical protein